MKLIIQKEYWMIIRRMVCIGTSTTAGNFAISSMTYEVVNSACRMNRLKCLTKRSVEIN